MKKTNFILSLLLGLFVTTFALTACSNDDDENNSLVGTWIIKTINGDTNIGIYTSLTQITLKSDGTGEFPGITPGYYVGWKVDGNIFRIDFGQGHPDDGLIGTYTLNGNTLTYICHTIDSDGKWESDIDVTVVLERK